MAGSLRSKHLSSSTPRGEAALFTTRSASGAVAVPFLPSTQGLFTHFEGVRRLDEMGIPGRRRDSAVPGRRRGRAPRLSGRLDLDPEVRQRPDERRRRGLGFSRRGGRPVRGRVRVEPPARAFSDDPRPVRRGAADAPLRPRPATFIPRRPRGRAGLGSSAVGRRVRRPASLDGLSARAPRHSPARRSAREGFRDPAIRRLPRRTTPRSRSRRPTAPRDSSRRSIPPSGTSRSSSSCRSSTSRRPTSRSPRGAPAGPTSRAPSCADRIPSSVRPTTPAAARLSPRETRLHASGSSHDVARAVHLVDLAGLLDTSRRNWFAAPPVSVSGAAFSVPA